MTNEFYTAYDAWSYLACHPMVEDKDGGFDYFRDCLSIDVVLVNPATREIDDDPSMNTECQIWLEFGPWDPDDFSARHDIGLDCGRRTFEEAIMQLATLVRNHPKYGQMKRRIR